MRRGRGRRFLFSSGSGWRVRDRLDALFDPLHLHRSHQRDAALDRYCGTVFRPRICLLFVRFRQIHRNQCHPYALREEGRFDHSRSIRIKNRMYSFSSSFSFTNAAMPLGLFLQLERLRASSQVCLQRHLEISRNHS